MSLKDLTKEQKQYIALGGIGAVLLAVVIYFGIKVSFSSISKAREELEMLEGKIESAERSLSKQTRIRNEFAETTETLRDYLRDASPNRNYYSWATGIIHSTARDAGLEVDAVDEQGRRETLSAGKKDKKIRLESYSLRVTAHGGYEALKRFLESIETNHPLARMITVDISKGSDPEIHNIQLVVQWPFNPDAITDAWKDVAEQQQKTGTADSEKMPVPPPPRSESGTLEGVDS